MTKRYLYTAAILIIGVAAALTIDKVPKKAKPAPEVAAHVVRAPTPEPEAVVPAQTADMYAESGDDVNGRHIGLIKSISATSLSTDYVQWIACTDCDNDYRILNDNTKLRTLKISPDAEVSLQTYTSDDQGGIQWNSSVTLKDFVAIFKNRKDEYLAEKLLYWLVIKDGEVVSITEQYQP